MVTGGAGFIGSAFARRILSTESNLKNVQKIIILDALTYAGKLSRISRCLDDNRFEFIHGDILDAKLVDRITQDVDVIVHFAAESHVDRSINSSSEFIKTNVLGTQVLLDAATKYRKRIVCVSTDEVYGSLEVGEAIESDKLNPSSPYSSSKASSDLVSLSYFKTHKTDVIVTRCVNNYGPFQDKEKLIPNFIDRLANGKNVPIYGSGNNVREWIHIDDHCDALEKIILDGESGEIYNIGSGERLSNLEVTKLLLDYFSFDENKIDFVEDRLGHDLRYALNWERVKKDFSWRPKRTLNISIEEIVESVV